MAHTLETFQELGKTQLEAVTTSSSSLIKSLETISVETTEYSRRSFETGSALFEKLRAAKSFESAIQIQSEYTKAAYELKSPTFYSGCQSEYAHIACVLPFGDEFRQRIAF